MSDDLVVVVVVLEGDTSYPESKTISYRKHQNHDFHVEESFDGGQWSPSGIKKYFS